MELPQSLASAPARLGAFGVVLALALGGGALVGATIGPDPAEDGEHSMTDADSTSAAASDGPGGLAISRDGYTLDLRTPVVDAAVPAELELIIEAPDGAALTEYEIEHDKELHLVVVGRDLANYAHVHPTRDADGQWTVEVPPMPAGSYRVFADFTPTGAAGLTLGADLTVPGDSAPVPLPPPSSTTIVDGYEVTFDGMLVAGTESELTVTVTRDGVPVTDLDPYLGALGHLVAIRNGDLAYLHVHPIEVAEDTSGPTVRFAVEVPTDGTYGLYFDFSHGSTVRTASVIASASDATSSAVGDETGEHDDGGHDD